MILVHRDEEVTFYNDTTRMYYTTRHSISGRPVEWNYAFLINKGIQKAIGTDVLGWWQDE